MVKHSISEGHRINFKDNTVSIRTADYMDHILKEVTEIWLHPNSFYKNARFTLSRSWNPNTNMLNTVGPSSNKERMDL
jgi:hypothetical protein